MIVLAAFPGKAQAGVTSASCGVSGNVLRYDCSATTSGAETAKIEFCETSSCAACGTYDRYTPSSSSGTSHKFNLSLLKQSTDYYWKASSSGGGTTQTGCFTTGTIPSSDPIAHATFTVSGTPNVENVLINFGCVAPPDDDTEDLVIVDNTGQVVWYEDPRDYTGDAANLVGALNIPQPARVILTILDEDRILEYDLVGNVLTDLVKGTDFTNTVHHDLTIKDGEIYVIERKTVTWHDACDCDSDGDTGESRDYQVDGVYSFDESSGSLDDEWDESSIYSGPDCSTGHKCDVQFAHTNSIWVDNALGWTLSLYYLDRVIMVDGDTSSGTYGDLLWEMYGDNSAGDFDIASSENFGGQHHVWWRPDGDMVMFDNHNNVTPSTHDARAIRMSVNWGATPYSASVDYGATIGSSSLAYCNVVGSAYDISPNSDDYVVVCGPAYYVAEFDSSESEIWNMTAGCTTGYTHGPIYRAVPIETQP